MCTGRLLKYASYFQRADPEDVVGIFAAYTKISEDEATERLKQHLDADDLSDLNRDQRIILASHRFAPEVTSAVVWLNEKAATEDLITCVELVPYRDSKSDSFYIQATTILPVPGVEEVLIGPSTRTGRGGARTDEVTRFFKTVASTARRTLPEDMRPDRRSHWAGTGPVTRYYQLWYSTPPWSNYVTRYQLLLPKETRSAPFEVTILFRCDKQEQVRRHRDNQEWLSKEDLSDLKDRLCAPEVATETRRIREDDRWLLLDESRTGDALDESFRDSVAAMVHAFIESVTPVVNENTDSKRDQ